MNKLVTLAAAAWTAAAAAQSPLATIDPFASNNSGSVGGALYFDLVVQTTITIAALDVNVQSGTGRPATCALHATAGTYLGNELDPLFWGPPASTGGFVTAPTDSPSFVPLETPLTLLPGNHAICLIALDWQHAYTNGDGTAQPGSGTNQTYANAELTLLAGAAQNEPFVSVPLASRVPNLRIHYAPGSTAVAGRSSTYGTGCYRVTTSVYEDFLGGTFDLGGSPGQIHGIRLSPNGMGGYAMQPGSTAWDDGNGPLSPGARPSSAPLPIGDDSVLALPLPANFGFFHPAGTAPVEVLYVGANGYVSSSPLVGSDYSPSGADLLAGEPRWCPAWADFEPNAQGSVHFDVDPTGTAVYVTWHDVPLWGLAGVSSSTFQVAFFQNGQVEYRYEAMDPLEPHTVGYSDGRGAMDPGPVDVSIELINGLSTGPGSVAPALAAGSRPVLGGPAVGLITRDVARNAYFGFTMLSLLRHPNGVDLGPFGLAGCRQYVGFEAPQLFLAQNGVGITLLGVPNDPALVDKRVFAQAAVFSPASAPPIGNVYGLTFTNGMILHVGDL